MVRSAFMEVSIVFMADIIPQTLPPRHKEAFVRHRFMVYPEFDSLIFKNVLLAQWRCG